MNSFFSLLFFFFTYSHFTSYRVNLSFFLKWCLQYLFSFFFSLTFFALLIFFLSFQPKCLESFGTKPLKWNVCTSTSETWLRSNEFLTMFYFADLKISTYFHSVFSFTDSYFLYSFSLHRSEFRLRWKFLAIQEFSTSSLATCLMAWIIHEQTETRSATELSTIILRHAATLFGRMAFRLSRCLLVRTIFCS